MTSPITPLLRCHIQPRQARRLFPHWTLFQVFQVVGLRRPNWLKSNGFRDQQVQLVRRHRL
ncbi:MAG: hypothetical protein ABIT10_11555, partial [Alteraurantiacibacter sp.]